MPALSFLDAALVVLSQSNHALTSAEITAKALERGLVTTTGKTPEASMSAALYVELGRPKSRVAKLSRPGPTRSARGSVRWSLSAR